MEENKNIKICVYVLTYNEEKRIKNTLESLKNFDEIMVHDKSSTDKTREIARAMGSKILKTEYYNDTVPMEVHKSIKEFFMKEQTCQWILMLTASDIIHQNLYEELINAIVQKQDKYDVLEVPMYRYSMGVVGKRTFFGGIEYKPILFKREIYPIKMTMVHESPFESIKKGKIECKNKKVAVYHLTHPNLEMVMDRHWRYAVQYVEDSVQKGKERVTIRKYAVKECVRLVIKYLKKRIYKTNPEGTAQLMMLIMYNCMIYLNAFFDEAREKDIQCKYEKIIEECRGQEKNI